MKVFEFDMKIKKEKNRLNFDISFINRYKNKLRIYYNNKIYPLYHRFSNIDNNIDFKINLISSEFSLLYEIHNIQYKKKEEKKNIETNAEDDEENYEINLFGYEFVKNNKDKCLIIYNGEIFPLQPFFFLQDIEQNKILNIRLIIFEKIYDLSYLFYKCQSLIKIELFKNNENNSTDCIKNLKNETSILDDKDNKYFKFYDSIEAKKTYSSSSEKNISITDNYTTINQKCNETLSSLSSYNIIINSLLPNNNCIKFKSIVYMPGVMNMSYMFGWCSSLNQYLIFHNLILKMLKICFHYFLYAH